MDMRFDAVYYEPGILDYKLGQKLRDKYANLHWIQIENHNRIPELTSANNVGLSKVEKTSYHRD